MPCPQPATIPPFRFRRKAVRGQGATMSFGRMAVVILVSGLSALTARADTITLTPAKDNSLFEDTTGSLSDGARPSLYAGPTSSSGSLPPGPVRLHLPGPNPP